MTSNIGLKNMLLALTVSWAGIPMTHAATMEVDKYPAKPIRLIAPFVPGGGTDITARAIAAKLTERWGQQVIVDNRAGAAGAIGVELTATAAPDGYTICLISASHSVNSATNTRLPYDLTRDLQAISQATSRTRPALRSTRRGRCLSAAGWTESCIASRRSKRLCPLRGISGSPPV